MATVKRLLRHALKDIEILLTNIFLLFLKMRDACQHRQTEHITGRAGKGLIETNSQKTLDQLTISFNEQMKGPAKD